MFTPKQRVLPKQTFWLQISKVQGRSLYYDLRPLRVKLFYLLCWIERVKHKKIKLMTLKKKHVLFLKNEKKKVSGAQRRLTGLMIVHEWTLLKTEEKLVKRSVRIFNLIYGKIWLILSSVMLAKYKYYWFCVLHKDFLFWPSFT